MPGTTHCNDSSYCSSISSSSAGSFIFIKQNISVDTGERIWKNFEICHSQIPEGIPITLMSESDALQIQQRPPATVFVVPFFEGRVFEYLLALNCCIVGPSLVLSCIQESKPLPKSTKPRYSNLLNGCIVSCSGIERTEREELHKLVEYMSGKFTRDLEVSTNVLIAADVTHQKYQIACEKNLIIVTSEWLYTLWRRSTELFDLETSIQAKSEAFCTKFKVPIFHNLVICVTGLKPEQRKEIEDVIAENGGRYKGQMIMGETTHLIADSIESTKYNAAIKWKLPVVNKSWFYGSLKFGFCKNPIAYSVEAQKNKNSISDNNNLTAFGNAPKNSTPNTSSSKPDSRFSLAFDENVSRISNVEARQLFRETSVANETTLSNLNRIDETTDVENLRGPSTKKSFKSPLLPKHRSDTSIVLKNGENSRTSSGVNSTITPVTAALNELDLTITTAADIMRKCRIFVDGFDDVDGNKLRKLVGACGGYRLKHLESSVSHIVLGPHCSKETIELAQTKKVPIMNARWLIDSFQHGKLLSVKNYRSKVENNDDEVTMIADIDSPAVPLKRHRSLNTTELAKMSLADDVEDEIMSQYVQEIQNGNDENQTEIIEVVEEEKTTDVQSNGAKENAEPAEEDNSAKSDEPEQELFFAGKTFAIVGFDEDMEQLLSELIEENGGIVPASPFVNFVVTPLIDDDTWTCGKVKGQNFVTSCYIQLCVERGNLIPVDEPIRLIKSVKLTKKCGSLLKNCVICISQFGGVEREAIHALCEALGAKFQESFSRRNNPTSGIFACTHLLLMSAEGDKFKAAKNWAIPALTADWIFECIDAKERVSEEPFLLLESKPDETKIDLPAVETSVLNVSKLGVESTKLSQICRATQKRPKAALEHLNCPEQEQEQGPSQASLKKKAKTLGDYQASDVDWTTPSKFLDPDKSFHPEFNLSGAFAELEEAKKLKLKTPDSVMVQRAIRKAVETTENAPTCLNTPATPIIRDYMMDVNIPRHAFNTKCDTPMCARSRARSTFEPSEAREARENMTKQLNNILTRSKPSVSSLEDNPSWSTTSGADLMSVGGLTTPAASETKKGSDRRNGLPSIAASNIFSSASSTNSSRDDALSVGRTLCSQTNDYRIGWDEPVTKQQRDTIQPMLKPISEPTQDIGDDDVAVLMTVGKPTATIRRSFQMTSVDPDLRVKVSKILQDLGASCSNAPNIELNCTHLILGKPSRNEKLLASIASGKWIIHPSYAEACEKAGKFVNDEDFEWGSPAMAQYSKQLSNDLSRGLAMAGRKWRLRIAKSKKLAYDGWFVLLLVGAEQETGLRNLLICGGAKVCEKSTPKSLLTHAFVKQSQKQFQNDVAALKAANVKCYKPEYLSAYLVDDPFQPQAYLL